MNDFMRNWIYTLRKFAYRDVLHSKLTVLGFISEDILVGTCANGDNLPVGGREALFIVGSVNALGPMLQQIETSIH